MKLTEQIRIASNIRYLRVLNNYTQTHIAEEIGLGRSSYSLVESGRRSVTADLIIDLSRFYKIDPSMILQLDEERFLSQVAFHHSDDFQTSYLAELFSKMSPVAREKLVERAEVLCELTNGASI